MRVTPAGSTKARILACERFMPAAPRTGCPSDLGTERGPVRPPDSEWGQVFGDEVLATAILDRFLHHCEVVSINGNSYRLKNRLQARGREIVVA